MRKPVAKQRTTYAIESKSSQKISMIFHLSTELQSIVKNLKFWLVLIQGASWNVSVRFSSTIQRYVFIISAIYCRSPHRSEAWKLKVCIKTLLSSRLFLTLGLQISSVSLVNDITLKLVPSLLHEKRKIWWVLAYSKVSREEIYVRATTYRSHRRSLL